MWSICIVEERAAIKELRVIDLQHESVREVQVIDHGGTVCDIFYLLMEGEYELLSTDGLNDVSGNLYSKIHKFDSKDKAWSFIKEEYPLYHP